MPGMARSASAAGNKNEESDGDGDAIDAEVNASRPKDSKKYKNKKIVVATHKLQYKPFTIFAGIATTTKKRQMFTYYVPPKPVSIGTGVVCT